jgi:hypothetical protein
VGPALSGVRATFGSEKSGWFFFGGSSTITSRPAAAIVPDVSAWGAPQMLATQADAAKILAGERVGLHPPKQLGQRPKTGPPRC